MCLGNYDEAQRTMNAYGLKSVVGTEVVPTTPGIDVKHDIFSSKSGPPVNLAHFQSNGGVREKQALSSSKLAASTAMSYPKSSKLETSSTIQGTSATSGHQRPSQRPPKSSISPKVNAQFSTVTNSQLSDSTTGSTVTRQPSPVSSKQYVKPVVPRPPSKQENRPKEKREKERSHHHHHVGKEKHPDKEKLKLQQQEKEKSHQKAPKLLNKPTSVKNDQLSSYENTQMKHLESINLNKTLSSVRPIMPPSKSPHNRMIGKEGNSAVPSSSSAVTAFAKPVPSKVPKPLSSPTMRPSFAGEQCVTDSHRFSSKEERADREAINTSMVVGIPSEKKTKEKKLKKKKHKLKDLELAKEREVLPIVEDAMELTSGPKPPLCMPTKKHVAQKPTSLNLRLIVFY